MITQVARIKYNRHKAQSKFRNIEFKITLDEWYNWWLENGVDKNLDIKWNSSDRPCMCRVGDKGAYELSNVYFATNAQNAKDKVYPKKERPIKERQQVGRGRKRDLSGYTQFGNVMFNLERLDRLKNLKPDANGCITWREGEGGRHRQGYLMMGGYRVDSDERFMTVAHRVEAMRKFGRELFHDDFVIHTCSNVKCLNPDHLILGDYSTQRQVMKDNGRSGLIGQGIKRAGVEYPQNRKYKYTPEEILWIRSATTQQIAQRYNMSLARAGQFRCGMKQGYKWLKDTK